MWAEIIKSLKVIAVISLILGGLILLGTAINSLSIWSWLTDIFSFFKWCLTLFDFFWDTDTMLTLLGYTSLIFLAYWVWKATLIVVDWFKPKS